MNTVKMIAVLLVTFLLGTSLPAATIDVPGDAATIQAGINAVSAGDTVLVAAGTYTGNGNRDIDFGGKAVLVMSARGPVVTIIDVQGSSGNLHRGFNFQSGEGAGSVVKGFTLRNGWELEGGGIRCRNASSPTIEDNIIVDNTASDAGNGEGGGIFCEDGSSPSILENIIMGNLSDGEGGGIFCRQNSSPLISGNKIMNNTAQDDGGGIFCRDFASPAIEDNVISNNVTLNDGGGIVCRESSSPLITGNEIIENAADSVGGGLICRDSSPVLNGNTFTGNAAGQRGGGIAVRDNSFPTAIHTILWDDTAPVDPEIHVDGSSTITVTFSDVEGGFPGNGNIDADPEFVLVGNQDVRLLWESPCIDSGDPGSLDADDTRRDIGANFFDQDDFLTLYLTPDEVEVAQGGQLGVIYTLINRMAQPEPFWILTEAILPNGNLLTVVGPDQFTLPAEFTAQVHLVHDVPPGAPVERYGYRSRIGVPPAMLYDEDSFTIRIVTP